MEETQEVREFDTVDSTPNQPATAETPAPVVTPEASAPTSPATTPAVPLDVLNQLVRAELGDSYEIKTPEDVARILGDKHREMRKSQELAAQAQTQLRPYEPFINRMKSDPAYNRRVYETSLEYAERLNGGQAEPGQDAGSPLYGEVLALKNWKEQREAQEAQDFVVNSMESLAKDPKYEGFITDDIKRDVALECAATGNYNPKVVFLDKYGDKAFAFAEARAVKKYSERVQATNAAGAGLGVPTSAAPMATPAVDPATLPPEQASAWGDNEIARIANDPKYAAKVAKEFQEKFGQG